ncbi:MAG: DNA polymerase III subunit beta [Bdellovibrionota bacterium]
MKIGFQKKDILKSLQRASAIAEKKTTMPILGNILLRSDKDKLFITATDLEIGMHGEVPCTVKEEGQICIPAQHLIGIIKELPADDVKFETNANSWVTISSGKAQFKIAGVIGDEFPKIPTAREFKFQKIKAETFENAIDKTSFAICMDEMRYNLNGSLVETETTPNGKTLFKMISTDGHRLAFYNMVLADDEDVELEKGIILPRKGIMELKRLLSESKKGLIQFGFSKGSVAFQFDDTFLFMRLVVGEFPDYTAVIPKNNDKKLTLDRNQFSDSLRRVSLLSEGKSKCVKFGIHGKGVLLKANSPELGEAEEEIQGEFNGGEMNIGFNARYVMDVINATNGDKVVLELNHEQSPGVFRMADDPTFFGVIMPMRV